MTMMGVAMSDDDPPVLPPRLWGYKVIGAAVGRSEAWALKWSKQGQRHRMPVVWVCGRPTITVAELEQWLMSWATDDVD